MSPGASVLFVSSIGAYLPFGMLGFYSVSKTALTALTKLLAQVMMSRFSAASALPTQSRAACVLGKQELAHEGGIRCNCIAPGIVKV